MALLELLNPTIPPAVISRIKIELAAHLLAQHNKINGAAIGSIIAKVLQNFPDSVFTVRQYGGIQPFVEGFLSDTLKYTGPGAGGDPLFEGILSITDNANVGRSRVQLDLPISAIPSVVISDIKVELSSHLSAQGNRINGAAIGGIIAKVLRNFPDSVFTVRQYGGMQTFVERFLSDSLKYVGPGAGGDPIFEGILAIKDDVSLWRALTHPKSSTNVILDQQFNLHLLSSSTETPVGWTRISPVNLQLQYDWAREFSETQVPQGQKQTAIELLTRNTSETFTFEWIGFLKRQSSSNLSTAWAKFRLDKIKAHFYQQLNMLGCPAEKIDLYTAQLQPQQASPRAISPASSQQFNSHKLSSFYNARISKQTVSNADLLKSLAHAYIDLASENELRDLKINLGTLVDAISRLDLNKN